MAPRLSWPMACGPIPDQGWNLCPCIGGGFLTTGPPGKFYISSFEKLLLRYFTNCLIRLLVFLPFPDGSAGKESAWNAGDTGDMGWKDLLEKGMKL